jgi:hypothetical protein
MNITLRKLDDDDYSGTAALPPYYAPMPYTLTRLMSGYVLAYRNAQGNTTPVGIFDALSDGTMRGCVLGLPATLRLHGNYTASVTLVTRPATIPEAA